MLSRRVLLVLATVLIGAAIVHADIYLHHPRGGNGRLNEGGRNRNNGDRLWDTQNNNRGGYNVGTFQRISYYQNTVVPIEWTQQHSCGNRDGNHCEMIIQYTCGDTRTRDGTTTNTIPTDNSQCQSSTGECDTDWTFGRHESQASYMACKYRSRNKGLFLGTQRPRGNSARFTRQNNNGDRSGYECPEERDYYPYWQPTIWRDIAIVTNRPERCAAFKAASQNVASRSFCQWDPTNPVIATKIQQTWQEGWVPITQAACESTANPTQWPGGKWIEVPAFNIAAPDCVMAPLARDNHLGNAVPASDTPDAQTGGYTAMYNWTIPSTIDSPYCVLRLRYNISTGEFPNAGFDSDTTVAAGVDSSVNVIPFNRNNQDNNGRYPAEYPLWLKYGLTRSDVNGSFTARVQNDDPDDDNNGGRLGGIRKSRPPSRDYTFRNNPQVDIFGDLLAKNISVAGGDPNYVGQPLIRVRLAINTAQFGRTFEDRSHVFEIRTRPAVLANAVIHNLSVRGKRGNIVQTYPGVEYDFVPDRLHVNQGDFVHIQWTGTGASRDEDEGDKHNIVLQRDANYFEQGMEWNTANLTAAGTPKYGHWGSAYPALINDTTQTHFLGLGFTHLRMLALWGINSSHFDLGPLQARAPGEFKYLCTRNNDFSNREQKAMIVVAPNPAWVALGAAGIIDPPQTVSMTGETSTASGHAILKQAYFDARPDFAPPGHITIEDVRPTDPAGEGEQNWFKVMPPVLGLGVDPKSLYLEADRPSPENFFYKGQIMWKLNEGDSAEEVIPNSNFFATRNKFAVQNGGYYQSSSVPNSAMIAGVSLGVLGLIVIFVYLYWRVRVQPEGSWKIFCSSRGCNICGKPAAAADVEGGAAASEAAALVSPAAASSSSAAAVTPARV